MIAFQAIAPGKGAFTDIPVPEPGEHDVLVKVKYCGICGTDYALFSGKSGFVKKGLATYPIRLGHEWSGVVEKTGAGVTKVRPGDRVIGDNFVSCEKCDACLAGDFGSCSARLNVGTIDPCWPGAFAEYYLIPERHVYRLADGVPLLDAALCEPLSVAYGGVKKMDMGRDSVVLVIGTGSIGMSAAALSLNKGAGQVYMLGRNAFKLEKARELGISGVINSAAEDPEEALLRLTGGRHADFVLECSGAEPSLGQCVKLAARGASVALIGFYERDDIPFDFDAFVSKELKMVGIMGEYGNLEAVAGIMASCDLRMRNVITDIVPFSECAPAFCPPDSRKIIKTIVEF
ncbi:MAG: alcohol dehydrogenase catalytic domain-containing protein [Clostridia bacterium]|nr:alcohol dehydrogenase catalytic domain-containing protein [Clostridia bacterium]MBR5767271.1 alcohol dehydrogenase catalytic domain-containing protein [Clostridia bacterium]